MNAPRPLLVLCGLCIAALAVSYLTPRPTLPVNAHILPSENHGCEIICKDGLCTIICPFQYGCKPNGDAYCVVENGDLRIGMNCCPMYLACHGCKCLRDGKYQGYCKDRVCTFKIPIAK